MNKFVLKAPYKPTGDQPQAIKVLVDGFKEGNQCQTLLGATGSGKTFTISDVLRYGCRISIALLYSRAMDYMTKKIHLSLCEWDELATHV